MATSASKLSAALLPALSNGTYPDDEAVLTAELTTKDIEPLLYDISAARNALEDEVRAVSRQQSGDVDQWIAQARKVQEDIARCKVVAADIVKEHEAVQRLQDAVYDARSKLGLLHGELEFSASLQQELQTVASVKLDLDHIESIMNGSPAKAAAELHVLQASAIQMRGINVSRMLERRRDFVARELHVKLDAALQERIRFGGSEHESWIEIVPDPDDSQTRHSSTTIVLEALDSLGTLRRTTEGLSNKIESQILDPICTMSSESHIRACSMVDDRLTLSLTSDVPSVNVVLTSLEQVIAFLHSRLPATLTTSLLQRIIPQLVSSLTIEWLTPSIPLELASIDELQTLQSQVEGLATAVEPIDSTGRRQLLDWNQQAPRIWLTKRRTASLHAVRIALTTQRGPARSVERIETQTVSKQDVAFAVSGGTDDWDAGWDDEAATDTKDEDEDVSAWDFDEKDAEAPKVSERQQEDAADTADAWGWDDDNPQETKTPQAMRASKLDPSTNGTNGDRQITLAETYTITDIPDHILEVVNKDIQEAESVKAPTYALLQPASPSSGLLQIPTFVLAMFRAIAPTYYTTSLHSGNMHLYNDVMYLLQRLRETPSSTLPKITTDCTAMERFARGAYAREMDTQRTILGDLLDGAQGFTNCSKQPYAMQCETAISSTVDLLRAIHAEWKPILSHSALLQSIGALLNHVTGKITADILDMEDIAVSDSQALVRFCNDISSLNDLFLPEQKPTPHEDNQGEAERVPMTAVYVPNWLRFQYLSNILDSSLVDIKYLWTHSELRMEFSAEEVVDLVRALFQESRQRKEAIAEIRADG